MKIESLGLNGSDRYSIADVFRRAATRQVIGGPIQPLQNRADRRSSGQALDKFLADVTRLEVGKDKGIRSAGNGATRRLALTDCLHQGRVDL